MYSYDKVKYTYCGYLHETEKNEVDEKSLEDGFKKIRVKLAISNRIICNNICGIIYSLISNNFGVRTELAFILSICIIH